MDKWERKGLEEISSPQSLLVNYLLKPPETLFCRRKKMTNYVLNYIHSRVRKP